MFKKLFKRGYKVEAVFSWPCKKDKPIIDLYNVVHLFGKYHLVCDGLELHRGDEMEDHDRILFVVIGSLRNIDAFYEEFRDMKNL